MASISVPAPKSHISQSLVKVLVRKKSLIKFPLLCCELDENCEFVLLVKLMGLDLLQYLLNGSIQDEQSVHTEQ